MKAIEAHGLARPIRATSARSTGISFSVEAGTIFGLLGPNGAGKSTTVKILTTLSRPDAGEARVAGIDVLATRTRSATRSASSPSARASTARRPGARTSTLQGELYGLRGRDAAPSASPSCSSASASREAGRPPAKTYSGGMQRRLDVAMGLVHRPQVLFLDEPTTGLDPEARAELWEEIARLARDERLTILLTTHYLEEADRLAAELAIVDRGRIVVEGTPEQLKGELAATAIQVELVEPSRTVACTARSRASPASASGARRADPARAGRRRRGGDPRRARRARAARRAGRPRSPSRVRRSTTSTCATRDARSTRPTPSTKEVS